MGDSGYNAGDFVLYFSHTDILDGCPGTSQAGFSSGRYYGYGPVDPFSGCLPVYLSLIYPENLPEISGGKKCFAALCAAKHSHPKKFRIETIPAEMSRKIAGLFGRSAGWRYARTSLPGVCCHRVPPIARPNKNSAIQEGFCQPP